MGAIEERRGVQRIGSDFRTSASRMREAEWNAANLLLERTLASVPLRGLEEAST